MAQERLCVQLLAEYLCLLWKWKIQYEPKLPEEPVDGRYAILTDEINRARSGMSTRQYKSPKKQNFQDSMSDLELLIDQLLVYNVGGTVRI